MEPATKEDLRELKTDLVKLMDVKFEKQFRLNLKQFRPNLKQLLPKKNLLS